MRRTTLSVLGVILAAFLGSVQDAPSRPMSAVSPWDQKFVGGTVIASAGDVNGDGKPDQLLANLNRAWIVFGESVDRTVHLDDLGNRGFEIRGATRHTLTVARAGDVNGDGLGDTLLGDREAPVEGRGRPGMAYIVFGKTETSPVDLSSLGNGASEAGFVIKGPEDFTLTGGYLSPAGDVNQDGLDDVLVGAAFANTTYVVFGKETNDDIDLRDFDLNIQGFKGYRISTPSPPNSDAYEVSFAGDFNGDGVLDAIIGVSRGWGTVFVVYGKSDPLPVDVSEPGNWGFRIRSSRETGYIGTSLGAAGDFNGDSRDDIVLRGAPPKRRYACFVLYGRTGSGTLMLSEVRKKSRIAGPITRASFGESHAPLDANGDDRSDLVIGAPNLDRVEENGGAIYVVYGSTDKNIDLTSSYHGYRIDGRRRHLFLGWYVDGIPDLDGDGLDEVAGGTLGQLAPAWGLVYMSSSPH